MQVGMYLPNPSTMSRKWHIVWFAEQKLKNPAGPII